MTGLYRVDTVRRLEHEALAARPPGALMRRAAAALTAQVERLARAMPAPPTVLALAGPGNNGADALLAALMLGERGWRVAGYAPLGPVAAAAPDPDGTPVRQAWTSAQGPSDDAAILESALAGACIVIDGLFGIGLARPIAGAAAQAVARITASGCPVVAVDVPSGIDADRGTVVGGHDAPAVRATLTVTLLADKPGLHTGAALDHVGALIVDDLGVPPCAPDGRLIDETAARRCLQPRPRDSHKGRWGSVAILGGAATMQGAALLAAGGAHALGAGKVFVATPDGPLFDPAHPHWMTRAWEDGATGCDALAIGCGLGRSPAAIDGVHRALAAPCPAVLDADALTLIAADPSRGLALQARAAGTVLTPHPLEAARLLACDTATVQADRIAAACTLADRTQAVVLLKGAGSVIAAPDGRWALIGSGAPTLGVAGTGDVLAGMVAALLGQRVAPFDAAASAAWLHGRAGERAQIALPRSVGLGAGELPDWVRAVANGA